mmetsp:Transcript_96208/g.248800  ORF Transcript_96208/g.248800 Transcript_96208/m.248800 type:complete len:215 (+) Transcript_96208:419-1063(+)
MPISAGSDPMPAMPTAHAPSGDRAPSTRQAQPTLMQRPCCCRWCLSQAAVAPAAWQAPTRWTRTRARTVADQGMRQSCLRCPPVGATPWLRWRQPRQTMLREAMRSDVAAATATSPSPAKRSCFAGALSLGAAGSRSHLPAAPSVQTHHYSKLVSGPPRPVPDGSQPPAALQAPHPAGVTRCEAAPGPQRWQTCAAPDQLRAAAAIDGGTDARR